MDLHCSSKHFHRQSHLIFTKTLYLLHYYSCFYNKAVEAQKMMSSHLVIDAANFQTQFSPVPKVLFLSWITLSPKKRNS